jgi:transcriptional regulator with XRE-family HTH domain
MDNEREITATERLRVAKGWSRERLAGEAGLSLATVERIEQGRTPQVTTAVKIATALDVSIADLFPVAEAAS